VKLDDIEFFDLNTYTPEPKKTENPKKPRALVFNFKVS
jgi:hypothetical protein